MGSNSGRQVRQREDAEILTHDRDLTVLRAVRDGEVHRGDGTTSQRTGPHTLAGQDITMTIRRLAKEDLVTASIAGPTHLAPRGAAILARADLRPV